MEDEDRVKNWYLEKLLIVAFSMITFVGTERNVIIDNMVLFKKLTNRSTSVFPIVNN